MEVKDGIPKLKVDSYMYQVQSILHISKREYCSFVVWSPKGMIHEVQNFYFNCLLSEIIDSIHVRKLAVREPKSFYKAQESSATKKNT
ncbi:hypothetical protein PR048_030424 [Dryococelus australis]|uniref:Uncharacterized protein n=1 Tax=Dryococelus australis TaxID=614101 RepID=A0ABQ9G8Y9_9NEOP|nr:hypothetical protein PR048_030424 [Dryococelus australis]